MVQGVYEMVHGVYKMVQVVYEMVQGVYEMVQGVYEMVQGVYCSYTPSTIGPGGIWDWSRWYMADILFCLDCIFNPRVV